MREIDSETIQFVNFSKNFKKQLIFNWKCGMIDNEGMTPASDGEQAKRGGTL